MVDDGMHAAWPNLFAYWQAAPLAPTRAAAPAERSRALHEATAPIGTAELAPDGSIVLDLRAETDGGAIGHAIITIAPNEPANAGIRSHIEGAARARSTGPLPFLPMTSAQDPQP